MLCHGDENGIKCDTAGSPLDSMDYRDFHVFSVSHQFPKDFDDSAQLDMLH
jgi:hypothetical protein